MTWLEELAYLDLAQKNPNALRNKPLYHVWYNMIARCTNPGHRKWVDYGARGITVCERWMSYENFEKDMAPRPAGMTLERQNNDKGYGPDNCVWADMLTQAQNRRDAVPRGTKPTFPVKQETREERLRRLSAAAKKGAAKRKQGQVEDETHP